MSRGHEVAPAMLGAITTAIANIKAINRIRFMRRPLDYKFKAIAAKLTARH